MTETDPTKQLDQTGGAYKDVIRFSGPRLWTLCSGQSLEEGNPGWCPLNTPSVSCLNIGYPQSSICLGAGFTMLVSYNFLDDILGYTSESGSGSSNFTLRGLNHTIENLTGDDEQLDTESVSKR